MQGGNMWLGHLVSARTSGATARRLLWLVFWGERAVGYAEALEMGIAEPEAVAAVAGGIWLSDYIKARRVASHLEILEARAATSDVFGYACIRGWGQGHDEAIETLGSEPSTTGGRERHPAPVRSRPTLNARRHRADLGLETPT